MLIGIGIDGNRTDASTLQGKYVALPDILELVESERNVELNAAIEKSLVINALRLDATRAGGNNEATKDAPCQDLIAIWCLR